MNVCVKCGQRIEEGVFCDNCRPEQKLPQRNIKLKLCANCNRIYFRDKWITVKDFGHGLDEILSKLYGGKVKVEFIDEFLLKPGIKKAVGIDFVHKKQKHSAVVDLEVTLCNNCGMQKSSYFEGILQLKNPTVEVMDFINSQMKTAEKKGVFITDEQPVKGGVELFLTNQTYLKVLANAIQKNFGGKMSVNEKLFSHNRQSGKDLFRLTILLVLPQIQKGDVIFYNNRLYLVRSLGERINVTDLQTETKTSIDYDTDVEKLVKEKTTISRVRPALEVLDPEDFSSILVSNQASGLKIGEKVKIVKKNGVWIVP